MICDILCNFNNRLISIFPVKGTIWPSFYPHFFQFDFIENRNGNTIENDWSKKFKGNPHKCEDKKWSQNKRKRKVKRFFLKHITRSPLKVTLHFPPDSVHNFCQICKIPPYSANSLIETFRIWYGLLILIMGTNCHYWTTTYHILWNACSLRQILP